MPRVPRKRRRSIDVTAPDIAASPIAIMRWR
jgi:hypothetical protein